MKPWLEEESSRKLAKTIQFGYVPVKSTEKKNYLSNHNYLPGNASFFEAFLECLIS